MPKPLMAPFEMQLAQKVMGAVHDHALFDSFEDELLELEIIRAIRMEFLEAAQHVFMVSFPEHDGVPDLKIVVGEHNT